MRLFVLKRNDASMHTLTIKYDAAQLFQSAYIVWVRYTAINISANTLLMYKHAWLCRSLLFRCVFSLSKKVFCVRCGIGLNWFLILPSFLLWYHSFSLFCIHEISILYSCWTYSFVWVYSLSLSYNISAMSRDLPERGEGKRRME